MARGTGHPMRIGVSLLYMSIGAACSERSSTGASPSFDASSVELGFATAIPNWFYFQVPGGSPVNAYVTISASSETISNVAEASPEPHEVYVRCKQVGNAIIKVHTGNGFWKFYPIRCDPPHDQGGGG